MPQPNPVNYVARNCEERDRLVSEMRVAELMDRARDSFAKVAVLKVVTGQETVAVWSSSDPRVIRIVDAIIREI